MPIVEEEKTFYDSGEVNGKDIEAIRSHSEPIEVDFDENMSQFSRSESMEIKDEARRILETYHRRLNSVGYQRF